MGFGCFSGDKDSKRHAQSQLKFLEEQNLELASALNEWQALVRQLQQEAKGLKSDNANLGTTVEQQRHTIEQQASEARAAEAEAVQLREDVAEARAQCHELKLLWEASVNECSQLDSQLAAELHKVTQLEHQIQGYRSDKEYLTEALEKREKALRMAEQVMDMVDMMQTPRGFQDLSEFNWGGEDLQGLSDLNGGSSMGGMQKGAQGGGLEIGPKGVSSGAKGGTGGAPGAQGEGDAESSLTASGQQALPPRSSFAQPQQGEAGSGVVPSVQRSQSPDIRNMGLRRSIQATKLVLAQSRTSGLLRPASAPETKSLELGSAAANEEPASRKRKAAGASGEGVKGSSPRRSMRSSDNISQEAGAARGKAHSSSSNSSIMGSSRQDKVGAGSARSSGSSSTAGVVRSKVVHGSAAGEGCVSRCSSARSSRSVPLQQELAPRDNSAQGPGPKQALVLRTPAADGSSIRRGSASGVLDSLVGSVVYDAMGPSPIHSSVQDDASVASSAAGALVQQGQQPGSLASSQQGDHAAGPELGKAGPAAAGAAKVLSGTLPPGAQQQQQLPVPAQAAAGSLAHKVALAMHGPQDSHKGWLEQQQRLLGESGSSTGSVNAQGSNDRDASLVRGCGQGAASLVGGRNGMATKDGASLTAAAACNAGTAQDQRTSARKGPSVRGPAGMLPGATRPSPLKLGAALDGGHSHRSNSGSKEDVVRDTDQGRVGMMA